MFLCKSLVELGKSWLNKRWTSVWTGPIRNKISIIHLWITWSVIQRWHHPRSKRVYYRFFYIRKIKLGYTSRIQKYTVNKFQGLRCVYGPIWNRKEPKPLALVLIFFFRNIFVLLEMSSTGNFKNGITPMGFDDDFIRNI